jgi:protein-disulfide isomerase
MGRGADDISTPVVGKRNPFRQEIVDKKQVDVDKEQLELEAQKRKRREEIERQKEENKIIEEELRKIDEKYKERALALLVGFLLLSPGGKEDPGQDIEKMLEGIPQEGLRLGDPSAKVVLIEWGDMQCPSCAEFAQNQLPQIIKNKVRPGKVAIEFRQWPILGPDSTLVAEAALAASLQDKYWQFIEYYYKKQKSGSKPSEDLLRSVAELSGVDIDRWQKDRDPSRWQEELLRNDDQALKYSFTGIPSFAIKKGGSPRPLSLSSLDDLFAELDESAP